MENLTRRGFLRVLAAAAPVVVAPAALAEILAPKRTIFLPPRGGWVAADVPVSLVALIQPYAESWKRTVEAVNEEVKRVLTVGPCTSGRFEVGMELQGAGIPPGTKIIALEGYDASEPLEFGDWNTKRYNKW